VKTETILIKCLADWLELDEGCTCSDASNLCLTCSSNLAVAQAKRWLQRLVSGNGEESKTTSGGTTEKETHE
jgi:hypothetical protein